MKCRKSSGGASPGRRNHTLENKGSPDNGCECNTRGDGFGWFAALTALVFLTACGTYQGPKLPTQLHLPADTAEVDRGAWELAAADWNAALLADAISRIDDREGGCGVFVVPWEEHQGHGGWTQVVADCRVEVMLRPGLSPKVAHAAARHEVAHALRGDAWHSSNPLSVLFHVSVTAEQMPTFCEVNPAVCDYEDERPQEIQPEELEFVRARLRPAPGGGV